MFDSLSNRLNSALGPLKSRGKLGEEDLNKALREVRLALLEADVNFKVVKQFTAQVKERALGSEVAESLTPGQQVVKIVNEELTSLMGGASGKIVFSSRPPTVILLAGLQGSGKTTAAAKLARWLRAQDRSPFLVACDTYRPAAIEQLQVLGRQLNVPVFSQGSEASPPDIAQAGVEQARAQGAGAVIVDTAGRLHIDESLMDELVEIKRRIKPHNVLLVLDAMTGQDAVTVAERFAEQVDFDGVILTKLDGDARGGAALSVKAVTGKPIKFVSTGEKISAFEIFHPDRLAGRILGMGDVLSLIEKAESAFDEDEARELERKMRKNQFTLEDFLKQMRAMRKMGPLTSVLGMVPGLGKQLRGIKIDDRALDRLEAIVFSMTVEERRKPEIINGSRRARIARGSGSSPQAVNQFLHQFKEMQKLFKSLGKGKMPTIPGLPRR